MNKKMIKIDEKKLAGLKTGSQHLAETYGEKGTPSREEFEAIKGLVPLHPIA